MDFLNTFFLHKVKEHNYSSDFVSHLIVFDLDNYFVLNNIPPNHWGIIDVLLKKQSITCFDGYHMEELEKYKELKKCLNILAEELNIIEYKNCEWQKKHIENHVYPRRSND